MDLRVCFVVLELSVGGLERMVVQLANGLVRRGVSSRIVIMEGEKYNALTLICELDEKVEIHYLQGALHHKLLRLRQLAKGHIVHIQFWGGQVKPLYRLFLMGQGAALITYQNVYTHMRHPSIDMLDTVMAQQLKAVVAVSNTVKEYCLDRLRIPQSKVHLIHNAIDITPTFDMPLSRDWRNRSMKMVSMGRLAKQKNQTMLFQAIAMAKQRGCNLHLTMIGDGPEICSLVELASELGIRNEITWLGEMWPKHIVGDILRQSDVFITASLWEGLPLAVLEAMAVGLPVIASDIPQHRETLADCAFYFSVDDVEDLARAIVDFSRGQLQWHDMVQRASVRVADHFHIDQAIDKHIELYHSLLHLKIKEIT